MNAWTKKLCAMLLPTVLSLSVVAAVDCPTRLIKAERLPSLSVARMNHATVVLPGGELLVAGGHSSGFVPTATAECFYDGEWHTIPMNYTHDQGLAMQLRSGEIILAGGHEQPLGIGQTFTLETYNPKTRQLIGYGCLDRKRCFATGLEMDSGKVFISGNWYHPDGIELYDGSRQCLRIKDVSQPRSLPYILRTARDNAIIFSSYDYHAEPFDTIVIDRLKGEPFTEPLFRTWRPFANHVMTHHAGCFVGNEAKGRYVYLIAASDSTGRVAIIKAEGERFSLLPTDRPVPMQSQWGAIHWQPNLVADSTAGCAYMIGADSLGRSRLYVLSIDYRQAPATLTLCYTEPQDSITEALPVVTEGGNLLLAGGNIESNNNYDPTARVLLLRTGSESEYASADSNLWLLILGLLLLVTILIGTLLWLQRKARREPLGELPMEESAPGSASPGTKADEELMQRICQLMEEQQLYRNSELRMADVAAALGTNSLYISRSINSLRGCTFTQFINSYRMTHAQQLLRQHPDMKISVVWPESGFASEASFFRAFKAATGMTPKEWMAKND